MSDYLILRKKRYFVRVAVPRSLWATLGRREIQRTTGTGDLAVAERRKHAIIAAIRDEIDSLTAQSPPPSSPSWLHQLSMELRHRVQQGDLTEELASDIMHDLQDRHLKAAGTHRDAPFLPSVQQARLRSAHRVATDLQFQPLDETIKAYLQEREGHVEASTLHKKRVELEAFSKWTGPGTAIGDINRKRAGQYLAEKLLPAGRSLATVKIAVGVLAAFWNWCIRRGLYDGANPWSGLTADLKGSRRGTSKKARRPWTPDELAKIDTIPHDDPMYAVLKLAQWTGCRLNELCHLKRDDVRLDEGMLVITEGKTSNAVRQVPIHPSIRDLVKGLHEAAVERDDEWLIGGLKEGGFDKKRGTALGKRLGRWIRSEVTPDPAVVVHTLRDSFITACERAGIPASTISLLVGHARQGLTLGVYSAGLEFDQLKTAMERVRY